jgi:hypothetical protein
MLADPSRAEGITSISVIAPRRGTHSEACLRSQDTLKKVNAANVANHKAITNTIMSRVSRAISERDGSKECTEVG